MPGAAERCSVRDLAVRTLFSERHDMPTTPESVSHFERHGSVAPRTHAVDMVEHGGGHAAYTHSHLSTLGYDISDS